MKLKYYHNGETHEIPLQSSTPAGKRLAVRHNNQTYYAPLVPTTDSAASDLRLVFGGETLALSKAATPAVPKVPFSFTFLDQDTETTLWIMEQLYAEEYDENNFPNSWPDSVRESLSQRIGAIKYPIAEIATVELTGDVPNQPANVTISFPDIWGEDAALYLIFTTDTAVEDYMLIEAVVQSDSSITFELPVAFIEAYLDTPMTMIVLQALE